MHAIIYNDDAIGAHDKYLIQEIYMTSPNIPSKDTWSKLSIDELYSTKSQITDIYFNAVAASATYANQFRQMVFELEALIAEREFRDAMERAASSR